MNIVAQIKRYEADIKDRQESLFARYNKKFEGSGIQATCRDQVQLLESLRNDPIINLLTKRILDLQHMVPITFVVSDPDGTIRSQIREATNG